MIKTHLSSVLLDNPDHQVAAALNLANRTGEVEDVVGSALLPASNSGAYINGQYIIMGGGTMAR